MISWNTGNTVVNGVRLHFTRTGGNKPPVVLAHGFSDAGLCWLPLAQALEAHYDLWAELLTRITCPALLITADLDRGAMVRPEMAAAMQQQMPQLQVAHVPGAGHSVRREQFDRYIAVVRSFLDAWAATYWQTSARS